ncbi:MAG: ketoacyl-ACP synthase III [Gammaproteobacteria bacterium]|nr:ketoacyl-ACP synthase III [Gammaproteobacteria bacterium]
MGFPCIIATGKYVPKRLVTNREMETLVGQPVDEWLQRNVGIKQRYFIEEDQTTSDLVVEAVKIALDRAGLSANQMDLLICSTDTPDWFSPATACATLSKLGANNIPGFDINSACSGWVNALDLAARRIVTDNSIRYIVVAGAYAMSRFLDMRDKYTATLFADGAGAVILSRADKQHWLGSSFKSFNENYDALGIFYGGANCPATSENIASFGTPAVKFAKKIPAEFNRVHWPALIDRTCEQAGVSPEQVDHFYFTQLNLHTIRHVMRDMRQPLAKAHYIMDKYGYTGSACLPMTLDDAIEQGIGPKSGDLLLFTASGGGITMASSLWKWL